MLSPTSLKSRLRQFIIDSLKVREATGDKLKTYKEYEKEIRAVIAECKKLGDNDCRNDKYVCKYNKSTKVLGGCPWHRIAMKLKLNKLHDAPCFWDEKYILEVIKYKLIKKLNSK